MTVIQKLRKLLQFLGEDSYSQDGSMEVLLVSNKKDFSILIWHHSQEYVIKIYKLILISKPEFRSLTRKQFLHEEQFEISCLEFKTSSYITIITSKENDYYHEVREFRTTNELNVIQLLNLVFQLL